MHARTHAHTHTHTLAYTALHTEHIGASTWPPRKTTAPTYILHKLRDTKFADLLTFCLRPCNIPSDSGMVCLARKSDR